ncbi:MAG: hypothetical protein IJA32_02105 [Lachnospiraceae bacterium]|nr:hypothetical protein [Lachnospiraceae bacterium]
MDYYLQRLKQGLVIPNSHYEWKEYRNQITKFILAHQKKKRIVLLGAGPSNDIDLGKLELYYEEIYLVDNRKEAMQEALRTYKLENNPKIKLVTSDFWEFPDLALEGLEECLAQKENITFISEYIEEMQNWAYQNTVYPKIEADTEVVVLGIHSQFNSCVAALINYYKSNYNEKEVDSVLGILRKWNRIAVERFHEYLFSNFSFIHFGYEYSSYENEGEYQRLQNVVSLFMNGEGQLAKEIHVARVDGAYEAEKNLSKLIWEKKVGILSFQYVFWNFSEPKGYLMCLYYLENLQYQRNDG